MLKKLFGLLTGMLLAVGVFLTQEKPMSVRVKTWRQDVWSTPGVDNFRDKGDYDFLSGLVPMADMRGFSRAPAWTSRNLAADFDNVRAVLYDADNDRVIFIGQDNSDQLAACYAEPNHATPWTFSAVTTLSTATTNAGGLHGRNAYLWGGYLWVIGADKHVYRGTSYTSSLTDFDTDADAYMLVPYGDRMYMVTEAGAIERLNDADSAFEAHYTPTADLDIVYLAPYRNYLYAFAKDTQGTLNILRIDSAEAATVTMEVTGQIPDPGIYQTYGMPFAQHGNRLYFSPGYQETPNDDIYLPVYSMRYTDTTHIDLVANMRYGNANDITSFVVYEGQLYLARLGTTAIGGYHQLNLIDTDSKTRTHREELGILRTGASTYSAPMLFNAGGHLVMITSSTAFKTAGPSGAFTSSGYLVTSYLDLGDISRQKRIERITAILDDKVSNTTITLKYLCDNDSSYTTAGTATSTRRASAGDIGATCYQVKVRIDYTEGGAVDDFVIEAIEILYSADS